MSKLTSHIEATESMEGSSKLRVVSLESQPGFEASSCDGFEAGCLVKAIGVVMEDSKIRVGNFETQYWFRR